MRFKTPQLLIVVGLVAAMVALGSAQTTTQKDKNKSTSTSTTTSTGSGSTTVDKIIKYWMDWFDSHDVKKDGQLNLEEQVSAFGLNAIPNVLAVFKKSRGDLISRDEFLKWCQEHAPAYAKQLDDLEKKHQDELKKLEDAHAKAVGDAKKKLEQEIRQARERHLREVAQHHREFILHHFARR